MAEPDPLVLRLRNAPSGGFMNPWWSVRRRAVVASHIALQLHHFYGAIETMIERVAVAMKTLLPHLRTDVSRFEMFLDSAIEASSRL